LPSIIANPAIHSSFILSGGEDMSPLNPELYQALFRYFGNVVINNQGGRAQVITVPDWARNGRPQTRIQGGEYYCVNCPFCTDTRHRLNINHLWATDDDGNIGQQNLHLAHCFNEGCIKNREDQLALFDMVFPLGRLLQGTPRPIRTEQDTLDEMHVGLRRIRLPTGLVSVNHSRAAQAGEYLRNRDFDPGDLWRRWRVCFCQRDSRSEPRIARPRIVVPVYDFPGISIGDEESIDEPILAGWQARVIENVPRGVPKYLTAKGMRKSALLYGLTAAVDTEGPVVICEGVTDVWRLRTNGIALFGKDMSLRQQRLLIEHFTGRPLVLFLDEDAQDKAREARNRLLTARRAANDRTEVVIARCPADRSDVGDCTTEEAWDQVAAALRCSRSELDIDLDNLPAPVHPREILQRFRKVPTSVSTETP